MRRSRIASTLSATAALCAAGALAGCGPPSLPPVAASARTARGAPVSQSAAYQAATASYRKGDIAGAMARIDALSRDTALTEPDRAFLHHQRAICRAALTGGKPAAPAPPTDAPPVSTPPPAADCGPRALLVVCDQLHVPASLPRLRALAGTNRDGTTLAGLVKAARAVGLQAQGVQMDRDALAHLSGPAIAWVDGNHYVAVPRVNGDNASVHDPNQPGEEEVPLSDLLGRSGGVLVTVEKQVSRRLTTK